MKYKLKRDSYLSSKKYVWRDGRCLGHIFSEVRDKQDVDWSKYKEDKTLRMTVSDRLVVKYNAICYPDQACGQYNSLKEAIVAMEKKQHELFLNLQGYDIVTIGADDV